MQQDVPRTANLKNCPHLCKDFELLITISIVYIWEENSKSNFAVFNVNCIPCSGNAGGFFYLMDTGVITAIPAPQGFDERYILLNDASFFEVSGPLSAVDCVGAVRLRELYRARSRVLRIMYAVSVDERSVEALAQQVSL